MSWAVTMIVVHAFAALGVGFLFRNTPDLIQKLILIPLIISLLLTVLAYSLAISNEPAGELIRWIAQEIEHPSVLLYIFRLAVKELPCKSYSPRSLRSQV